jgi:EpsI family protein
MSFLRGRSVVILSIVLILQASLFYAVAQRPENAPEIASLSTFPQSIGGFNEFKVLDIDQDTRDLLKADDLLSRGYTDPTNTRGVQLFVAYFKTQRYGQSPHSPKNCLPGSGWEPISTDRPTIEIPGVGPIVVNRYVVERGDAKSVTLYWYQSHNRVIASEYAAKLWLVADALRYHRSDTSLVRVTAPAIDGNVEAASAVAMQFVQVVFPQLRQQMPM